MIHSMYNGSGSALERTYSPLMLNNEWSKVGRLLFMIGCTGIGSILNGFFVSSFFIERTLKKLGNVFLACAGAADLLVTSVVMAVSSVVILTMGEWDILPVCRAMHLLTETATYAYSVFFLLAAAENFYRICGSKEEYHIFKSMPIALMSFLIYCMCFAMSVVGVVKKLDYDYCERKFYGNNMFKITTTASFHGIPMILTLGYLSTAISHVQRRSRREIQYKRSQQYERDHSITTVNMTAYILFLVGWIPHIIIVTQFPDASDSTYYNSAWLGLCRTIFTSLLYALMNRNFKRAFGQLFNYCFFKISLSTSYANRHRRMFDYRATTVPREIQVHVMHQIMTTQRGMSSARQIYEL